MAGSIDYCTVTVENLQGQTTVEQIGGWLELASGTVWKVEEATGDRAEFSLPERYGWGNDDGASLRIISRFIPEARITAICETSKAERWVIYAKDGKIETRDEITDFPPSTLWPTADVEPAPAAPGIAFDARETATILAALRLWSRQAPCRLVTLPELAVATDGGTLAEMSAAEISDLCERINYGGE